LFLPSSLGAAVHGLLAPLAPFTDAVAAEADAADALDLDTDARDANAVHRAARDLLAHTLAVAIALHRCVLSTPACAASLDGHEELVRLEQAQARLPASAIADALRAPHSCQSQSRRECRSCLAAALVCAWAAPIASDAPDATVSALLARAAAPRAVLDALCARLQLLAPGAAVHRALMLLRAALGLLGDAARALMEWVDGDCVRVGSSTSNAMDLSSSGATTLIAALPPALTPVVLLSPLLTAGTTLPILARPAAGPDTPATNAGAGPTPADDIRGLVSAATAAPRGAKGADHHSPLYDAVCRLTAILPAAVARSTGAVPTQQRDSAGASPDAVLGYVCPCGRASRAPLLATLRSPEHAHGAAVQAAAALLLLRDGGVDPDAEPVSVSASASLPAVLAVAHAVDQLEHARLCDHALARASATPLTAEMIVADAVSAAQALAAAAEAAPCSSLAASTRQCVSTLEALCLEPPAAAVRPASPLRSLSPAALLGLVAALAMAAVGPCVRGSSSLPPAEAIALAASAAVVATPARLRLVLHRRPRPRARGPLGPRGRAGCCCAGAPRHAAPRGARRRPL
jgi:hypothetical protein